MITCPWCGTNYLAFQSNCKNCGGPLPAPRDQAAPFAAGDDRLPDPPPPPRIVADSYAWRLMFTDGWGVAGLVFTLLGSIFTLLGAALTAGIITAIVGLPFLAIGLAFLVVGSRLLSSRYKGAQQTIGVLRFGQAAAGTIAGVEENLNVRVNSRHPWNITYQFRVQGQQYQGRVSTLNPPGPDLQPGRAACVLYLPEAPQHNSLYPHP